MADPRLSPWALLSKEQHLAAATLGFTAETWASQTQAEAQLRDLRAQLQERDLRLRQYVPKYKLNEVVDELQLLQKHRLNPREK